MKLHCEGYATESLGVTSAESNKEEETAVWQSRSPCLVLLSCAAVLALVLLVTGKLALATPLAVASSTTRPCAAAPLRNPCCKQMHARAPDAFAAQFATNYGCV